MILALLAGLIIGFILAIPPGPVAVTAFRFSIEKGLKHGTLIGLGTGLMDFIYCLLCIFATSAMMSLVNRFTADYPILILLFQITVIIAVILFGVINLKQKNIILSSDSSLTIGSKSGFLNKLAGKGPFLLGIAVAIANIANPTFLPSLAYMTVAVHKVGLIEDFWFSSVLFALGFGAGNFFWIYTVSRIITYYKDRFSPATLARIHQFAGFTLIGVGTVLGYRVLTLTHWAELVRIAFAF